VNIGYNIATLSFPHFSWGKYLSFFRGGMGARALARNKLSSITLGLTTPQERRPPSPPQEFRHFPHEKWRKEGRSKPTKKGENQ